MELDYNDSLSFDQNVEINTNLSYKDIPVYMYALGATAIGALATAITGLKYQYAQSAHIKADKVKEIIYNEELAWRNARWALEDNNYVKAKDFVSEAHYTKPEQFTYLIDSDEIEDAMEYAQDAEDKLSTLLDNMDPYFRKTVEDEHSSKNNFFMAVNATVVAAVASLIAYLASSKGEKDSKDETPQEDEFY